MPRFGGKTLVAELVAGVEGVVAVGHASLCVASRDLGVVPAIPLSAGMVLLVVGGVVWCVGVTIPRAVVACMAAAAAAAFAAFFSALDLLPDAGAAGVAAAADAWALPGPLLWLRGRDARYLSRSFSSAMIRSACAYSHACPCGHRPSMCHLQTSLRRSAAERSA